MMQRKCWEKDWGTHGPWLVQQSLMGDPTPRAKAEGSLVGGFLNPMPLGREGELGCVSLFLSGAVLVNRNRG